MSWRLHGDGWELVQVFVIWPNPNTLVGEAAAAAATSALMCFHFNSLHPKYVVRMYVVVLCHHYS